MVSLCSVLLQQSLLDLSFWLYRYSLNLGVCIWSKNSKLSAISSALAWDAWPCAQCWKVRAGSCFSCPASISVSSGTCRLLHKQELSHASFRRGWISWGIWFHVDMSLSTALKCKWKSWSISCVSSEWLNNSQALIFSLKTLVKRSSGERLFLLAFPDLFLPKIHNHLFFTVLLFILVTIFPDYTTKTKNGIPCFNHFLISGVMLHAA